MTVTNGGGSAPIERPQTAPVAGFSASMEAEQEQSGDGDEPRPVSSASARTKKSLQEEASEERLAPHFHHDSRPPGNAMVQGSRLV